MLVANKADRFFDENAALLWQQDRIGEHKIFDPFRDDLIRLQKQVFLLAVHLWRHVSVGMLNRQ